MFRAISIEGFVFWWISFLIAGYLFVRFQIWLSHLMAKDNKLKRRVKIGCFSLIGVTYLYCMFFYLRTLG